MRLLDEKNMNLPEYLEGVRAAASKALEPILPASDLTAAPKRLLLTALRTEASRQLPPYYLVYFLLVDLLGFRNLGQFEKLAWSVPIDYNGKAFLIEHRKFGLGIFVDNPEANEAAALEIANRLQKAIKVARPYFEWRAKSAVNASKLNVINHTDALNERFNYFLSEYNAAIAEIRVVENRKKEMTSEERMSELDYFFSTPYTHTEKATWLASSVIDAFFSFTEHVFIHLAALQGKIFTGNEVASLAGADWAQKYKSAFDLRDQEAKFFYDNLIEIRRQHRNFVAHGSFGKQGEAFTFHSDAGAVPVLLPHIRGQQKFALTGSLTMKDSVAIRIILRFMEFLWEYEREPARIYLQRTSLPVILTMVTDGTYSKAMQSCEEMKSLVEHLEGGFERSINMEF